MKKTAGEKFRTLTFDGEMTLRDVGAMADEVREALKEAGQIMINLEGATDIDLSVLQLLCSVHRSLAGMGKKLVLEGTIPAAISHRVIEAGFHRHLGCSFVSGHQCIWTDALTS
jgi:ABC-type transporter Mla MlaB component